MVSSVVWWLKRSRMNRLMLGSGANVYRSASFGTGLISVYISLTLTTIMTLFNTGVLLNSFSMTQMFIKVYADDA